MSEAALGLARGTVGLAEPDGSWPALFAAERARLRIALDGVPVEVEHVGSTAVPGLVAKPILDLLLGMPPGVRLASLVEALEGVGYAYRGEHGVPGRHYFVRDDERGRRTHHAHAVALGSPFWREYLAFRDHLRAHAARRAEYAALKQALAARHAADRAAYGEGKAAFIRETLARHAGPA